MRWMIVWLVLYDEREKSRRGRVEGPRNRRSAGRLQGVFGNRLRPAHERELNRTESPPRRAWTRYSWLLWENRRLLYKATVRILVVSTVVALLIPSRFQSTVNIMPPEQGDRGALLSLLAGRGEGNSDGGASGLASLAGSFLGMSSSGALFVELIQSRTVEDHIIDRFNLQKVYRARYKQDARNTLATRTGIEQDRKSGVISITVSDTSPPRAREIAQAYVEELDHLLSQVSTSSARRERIFIEQRLAAVKNDLEDAERRFSAFASKNNTLDIKEQAKAEVEAAAVLQGQLIGAQSELQGLQQIYTGNNVRVRSLKARIDELRQPVAANLRNEVLPLQRTTVIHRKTSILLSESYPCWVWNGLTFTGRPRSRRLSTNC